MLKKLLTLSIFFLPLACGCETAKPQLRPPQPEVPAAPVAEEISPPIAEVETEKKELETIRVKADIGMTGKGQYNHGGGEKAMDIILVPVSQNFQIRERLALQQIQHAESLYKATHEKLPDTHEEYMKDVLQGMALPKLPDGHKYVYDPKEQQLMIEKPK